MQLIRLASEIDYEGWRNAARAFCMQGMAPENIEWRVGEDSQGLFDTALPVPQAAQNQQPYLFSSQERRPDCQHPDISPFQSPTSIQPTVPRDFIALSRKAILHQDPTRFALLYRLLWRLQQTPKLLQVSFDPDVARLQAMVKAVRRDLHKMKAFVRFREIEREGGDSEFVAWFEPSHHIVEASASFFSGRFTNMRWSILTPKICMHWDGKALHYSPGGSKSDAPAEDADEMLWQSYYRSIFNPARLKVSAMQAEMPKKYWRNLPEAALIAELIASATQRMDTMIAAAPTQPRRKIVKYVVKKTDAMPSQRGNE
jgi:uracil-DNA glycosylase